MLEQVACIHYHEMFHEVLCSRDHSKLHIELFLLTACLVGLF